MTYGGLETSRSMRSREGLQPGGHVRLVPRDADAGRSGVAAGRRQGSTGHVRGVDLASGAFLGYGDRDGARTGPEIQHPARSTAKIYALQRHVDDALGVGARYQGGRVQVQDRGSGSMPGRRFAGRARAPCAGRSRTTYRVSCSGVRGRLYEARSERPVPSNSESRTSAEASGSGTSARRRSSAASRAACRALFAPARILRWRGFRRPRPPAYRPSPSPREPG